MTLKLKNLFYMCANICDYSVELDEEDQQFNLIQIFKHLSTDSCTKCGKYETCSKLLSDLLDIYEEEMEVKLC